MNCTYIQYIHVYLRVYVFMHNIHRSIEYNPHPKVRSSSQQASRPGRNAPGGRRDSRRCQVLLCVPRPRGPRSGPSRARAKAFGRRGWARGRNPNWRRRKSSDGAWVFWATVDAFRLGRGVGARSWESATGRGDGRL